jgi:UDP-N-acetylglucosamine 3-dehydrogenase
MKIMQIGAGRWGSNHIRVLRYLQADLYIAEISGSGRRLCLELGISEDHITDDYQTFLDRVDAVDVVTPAATHFSICKDALQEGKDVFMEKPVAEASAEAEELAALAAGKGAILQVGFIFRFDPATDYIRECITSGELGTLQSMTSSFSGFKRPRSDGGVTISDSIHFIDLFNYLVGSRPRKVLARCDDLLKRGMDDMSWIMLDYDGIPALVESNYFSPDKKRLLTIVGDQATLVCDFSSSQDKIKIYKNQHVLDNDTWKTVSGEVITREIPPSEPLFLELQDFLKCVATRSAPRADARAGVDSLKIVEAAMRSHQEGRAITV